MKRLYLIIIFLSLLYCQINEGNSEKEKENKNNKNVVKCFFVSLVIFRQSLPVNLQDDEAVIDSSNKGLVTYEICKNYLNKKDGVD